MTPETVRCQCQLSPGTAVIGGGALTGGVNRLPPVGLIDFSVGDSGAVDDGVVVVVVVDVSGAFSAATARGGQTDHRDDRSSAYGRRDATSQTM